MVKFRIWNYLIRNLLIYFLNFSLNHSLYTLIKHCNEFLDPDNIAVDTTIIAEVQIIRAMMFSFEKAVTLDFIFN
jgi:hypothetical protein